MNLVGGENNENTKYFLDLALKELLEYIMQWNTTDEQTTSLGLTKGSPAYYCLELDTHICTIFRNLINSDEAFGYGSRLASEKDIWILQRFSARILHKNQDVRSSSINLFYVLMKKLKNDT